MNEYRIKSFLLLIWYLSLASCTNKVTNDPLTIEPQQIDIKSQDTGHTTQPISQSPPSTTQITTSYKPREITKTSRICIIGAGPSGITAAMELKKRGYNDITILEKNNYIGGQCFNSSHGMDMGAIVYFSHHNNANKLAHEVGIKGYPLDDSNYYSIHTHQIMKDPQLNNRMQIFHQGMKYLFKRLSFDKKFSKHTFGEIDPELHKSWREFVRDNNITEFYNSILPITLGFGYREEMPALYNLYYLRKEVGLLGIISLANIRLKTWEGGSQKIWEQLVKKYNLNIIKNINITSVTRHDKINVTYNQKQSTDNTEVNEQYDLLINSANPKTTMSIMDTTEEEREIYSQIKTLDYRVYEVAIDGIYNNIASGGGFYEYLVQNKLDVPLIFLKKYRDKNIFIVYVNPSENQSDDIIEKNIINEFTKMKGQNIKILSKKRWDYFPYVNKESLEKGFYKKINTLQGLKNTYGVGVTYTFNLLPDAIGQARERVREILNEQ